MSGATTAADDTAAPSGAVADSGPAPAPVATAAAVAAPETAPAPGAAPAAAETAAPAVVAHTDTATLLEGAGDKPPAEDDAAPAPEVTAPPAVAYEPFTLPEGLSVDKDRMDSYTALLGAHGIKQEAGQALIEMHTAAMQQYAAGLLSDQHRAFADMRSAWREQVRGDAELGGAGHQTAMAAVARMRDLLVPAARRDAFNDFLRVTGAGDHPEFLRILHAASRLYDEPAVPPAPHRPPPNIGKPPRGGRAGAVYDHPTSQRIGGAR